MTLKIWRSVLTVALGVVMSVAGTLVMIMISPMLGAVFHLTGAVAVVVGVCKLITPFLRGAEEEPVTHTASDDGWRYGVLW